MKKHLKVSLLIVATSLVFSCSPQSEPPHEHTFDMSSWESDSSYHWHLATCGHDVKGDLGEHAYGPWIISNNPTSEVSGKKYHKCDICGYREELDIPYVKVKADRVYLNVSAVTFRKGYTYSFNPVIAPKDAYKNIKYIVNDPEIVSFNGNIATGNKVGETLYQIYNDFNDNNILDSDEASVIGAISIQDVDLDASVEIDEPNVQMMVGESHTITYNLVGISTDGFDVGFYSEDENIVTTSEGVIKAHKPGSTRVYVSCDNYRGYINVTVSDFTDESGVHANSVSLDNEHVTISKGDTYQIKPVLVPENAVDTIVSYSSNNEKVASVNSSGLVTALSAGSALITVTTSNGKETRLMLTVYDTKTSYSDPYDGYYNSLTTWENGEDLKTKLHAIISNIKPLKYKGTKTNWESNQDADKDLDDPDNMLDVVYSANPVSKDATTSGWQREHVFAASLMCGYGTGSAVEQLGRATDFHNLFASHAGANGSRGNRNFAYVNKDSAELKIKEDTISDKKTFEPSDYDKGRIARAAFYMTVMYDSDVDATVKEKWTFKGEDIDSHSNKTKTLTLSAKQKSLELVNDVVDYGISNKISLDNFMLPTNLAEETLVEYYRSLVPDQSSKTSNWDLYRQKAYELYMKDYGPWMMGGFDDLLKWTTFEVDALEMQHNNSVYSYNSSAGGGIQGNRNPFVDYPELINYIFGDLRDTPGSLSNLRPSKQ